AARPFPGICRGRLRYGARPRRSRGRPGQPGGELAVGGWGAHPSRAPYRPGGVSRLVRIAGARGRPCRGVARLSNARSGLVMTVYDFHIHYTPEALVRERLGGETTVTRYKHGVPASTSH